MEATTALPGMDREFIARNQIVERYLSGRLPPRGAVDFERFCRENPDLLDELGLPARVNAGLRLLEAGGQPEPWHQPPKKFWEQPRFAIALGGIALALLVTVAVLASKQSSSVSQIEQLRRLAAEQPLKPATATRTIRIVPSRAGESNKPAVTLGGGAAQLADLRFDMAQSPFRAFRVTVDRIDQGRVAVLHNLLKDSNGQLRIALNDSALGPGNYRFTLEGLNWRGEPAPDAWATIGITR